MRVIKLIVVHCSATPPSLDIGADEIRKSHTSPPNEWDDIGYHFVIRRNGNIENGRHVLIPGAHVRGHNKYSIGICLIGGVDNEGKPDANYTFSQYAALQSLVFRLKKEHGQHVRVVGHRDLSPDLNNDGSIQATERLKECPCMSVEEFFK